ncbi:unnamed protein product [Rotaria sp. Silwood1]|nr:unnamed protein product [Rotaria sp. Silwood1]CAF3486964.1 unnamed protein product [Rotaria sp. Silwood1]CAF3552868.1 unnamed protein product [Rotaria sp. Silwood1]CAF4853657.1 unnamed protein product [Rotaria sp. Silwood1]CAF4893876.1 unnamed protein product [Rotaria sp. Silwood1]
MHSQIYSSHSNFEEKSDVGWPKLLTPIMREFAKLTTRSACKDCFGKIHTQEQLQLVKQPLIINKNQACQNEKTKFFIIVKSGSFQRRNFTRSTWAQEIIEHFNVPVLYAIGYPQDSAMQKEIIEEDEKYHDLLQFNFLESYYNLTLKTTSVLVWYDQHCSKNSDYLFYVDDDVLIHVDKLILYMNQVSNNDTIEGWFEKSGKIQRKGIGGVSKENFPINIVPDYLWGAAVLYPSNIISNLLIKAIFNTTIPIFFRDDVFINGFMAEQAGIKRKHMKGILTHDQTEDDLKTNMIIIDFKNEENRQKAWNCYKYNIQCNKNLPLLLFRIFAGISLFIVMIGSCYKYFTSTFYYKQLKHEFDFWYYTTNQWFKQNMNLTLMRNRRQYSSRGIQKTMLGVQWLINLRRMINS